MENDHLNAFEIIDNIFFENKESLEEYFWNKSHAMFRGNSVWMKAARTGGGLQINDPVYKNFWSKHHRLLMNYWDEEKCYCKHNCSGTHTTIKRAADAQRLSSQANIRDCLATIPTTLSWSNNQQAKLDKGKTVEQKRQLSPPPTPLNIVSGVDRYEVFIWYYITNPFLKADAKAAIENIQTNLDTL
jgi:hypothetical protein